MHLFDISAFEQQEKSAVSRRVRAAQAGQMAVRGSGGPAGVGGGNARPDMPSAGAGAKAPEKAASELPSAPPVVLTEPVNLRPSLRDFSKPAGRLAGQSNQDVPAHQHRQSQLCQLRAAD